MNTDKLQMEGIFKEGYGNISKLVMKDRNLTIGAKAVYAYLCSYSGAGGIAYPSRSLICHDLKISQETLSKHLKNLEEQGYILREQQRSNGSFSHNIYTILTIPKKSDTKITDIEKTDIDLDDIGKLETNNNSYNNNSNNNNNKNTYIVENKENLTEKEKIKNLSSLSENTLPISETSKNIETSKKQETSKEEPTKKKSFNEKENKNKAIIEEVIAYLNEKTGKHFTPKNKETVKFINGRLSEGYTVSDLKMVIDNRCEKWLNDEKMNEYLRPSTLFRPSNFEAYYNDVLSMKEKAVSEKEQEVIESFRGLLTPPSLPPKQALEQFKKDNNIVFMTESDLGKFEKWYKTKIDEWLKKLEEKRKKDMEVILNERAKNQTNVRTERYLRNLAKSRKF